MSDERDVLTTGWKDSGADPAAAGTGATAVPDPRAEARMTAPGPAPAPGDAGPPGTPPPDHPVPPPADEGASDLPAGPDHQPGTLPTVPVTVRPRPRLPRRAPMIRMGPWAPVAGAGVGLLLGVVVVLFLAPAVTGFAERLSLVFVVLGLALLGAGGVLLADEVRLLRKGTQAVEARSASAGVIAGLLNGLTPARLLITASAFCLLLSAYVTNRG
ncbi:hypothetical protein SAMN05661080_00504 [Modestobacter sp. DSM 44400]|uniref:hypothetical protein n=1 Tax=Modestobacter sp. DSM 44400 TaxID=1550230 RepID=UPI00089D5A46|nr:hypothetical protein [Modestobacter sp. DSM 44400]SDX59557.1 hypothetical protein SAMN05661080_00504 [Modestobacter sp. DSM 44400]